MEDRGWVGLGRGKGNEKGERRRAGKEGIVGCGGSG